MIEYNGQISDTYRVIVERYPARPIPQRKQEKWSVPGRSGDLIAQEDAWENVTRTYEVYISAEGRDLHGYAAKAIEWLMAPGYHRLRDSYDRDTFVMATYTGGTDIANIFNKFGRWKLSFDCWPQRFLCSGAKAVSVAQGGALLNPTIYPAQPLIVVQGSGAGVLTINGQALTLSDCNGITLDCRDEEAWRGVSNLNSTVSGAYPRLTEGENRVSWSGGITGVAITPRWFVI